MLQMNDANCPVSVDVLGRLYRSDPDAAVEMLEDLPERRRIELAVFCYGRSHLRPLGLKIATTCDPARLVRSAGVIGQLIAAQCQDPDAAPPRARISLAGTRH